MYRLITQVKPQLTMQTDIPICQMN